MRDFKHVWAATSGYSLRYAEPDAVILPDRSYGVADAAKTSIAVADGEQVKLVYTCTDLYMTAMGRAVFGGEVARKLLGLTNVTSSLRYPTDNLVLRNLIEELPHIELPRDNEKMPTPEAGCT